ncbi:MAG: UbiA family prenyltransferase [Hyphomicrobium sp.]|uniref:UbiA family prenyltransferase n=1 Tax=Hyphomicrobium sp. TaxID=82 RepID=UPI003D0F30DB
MSTLSALLRLARISNLPTIWSNVLAASVLADGLSLPGLTTVLAAMSALYTGGMVLNDAFDHAFDTRMRPERPLPSGEVAASAAWLAGGSLLAAGVALLATFGWESAIAGLTLAALILIYDAWHKGNPLSPVIMGACRGLVYIGTALAAGAMLSAPILAAALALLLYVVALTFLAKRGFTRVGALIAAISLLDAGIAAASGNATVATVCACLFLLTLALQRVVSGT